VKIPLT